MSTNNNGTAKASKQAKTCAICETEAKVHVNDHHLCVHHAKEYRDQIIAAAQEFTFRRLLRGQGYELYSVDHNTLGPHCAELTMLYAPRRRVVVQLDLDADHPWEEKSFTMAGDAQGPSMVFMAFEAVRYSLLPACHPKRIISSIRIGHELASFALAEDD